MAQPTAEAFRALRKALEEFRGTAKAATLKDLENLRKLFNKLYRTRPNPKQEEQKHDRP